MLVNVGAQMFNNLLTLAVTKFHKSRVSPSVLLYTRPTSLAALTTVHDFSTSKY